MPDAELLAEMYGVEYAGSFEEKYDLGESKEHSWTIEHLRDRKQGTFVDYGCGEGALLTAALALGWQTVGVEYDPLVVEDVRRSTGATMLTTAESMSPEHYGLADVLHLGDVLEHLTQIDVQLPQILRLLKPGGMLLAQGPLEGNWCLFFETVRTSRKLRPSTVEMMPYHVMLATAAGQERLFERHGLTKVEFHVSETSWPAPARIDARVVFEPRLIALYAVRKLSQFMSSLNASAWGNRYRYSGRL